MTDEAKKTFRDDFDRVNDMLAELIALNPYADLETHALEVVRLGGETNTLVQAIVEPVGEPNE